MIFKKKGLPKEDEVIFCTVKRILSHSTFVDVDEYENVEGMISVWEIAPGRIRNIRDYVREGKRIVCLVLKVYPERRYVELSLRRVSSGVRKQKEEFLKQEQKSVKILERIAEIAGENKEVFLNNVGRKIIDKYGSLSACLKKIAFDEIKAEELKDIIGEKYIESLVGVVKEKIKPQKYVVNKIIKLSCDKEDGVVVIKNALNSGFEYAKKHGIDAKFIYIGAPKYKIEVIDTSYKSAENAIDNIIKEVMDRLKEKEKV